MAADPEFNPDPPPLGWDSWAEWERTLPAAQPGSPQWEREHPSGSVRAVGGTAQPSAVTVNLADVEPQSVEWLWSGWVPQARLSLVIGHAGQGKSWLTLALAAAVSRGWPLPGDEP